MRRTTIFLPDDLHERLRREAFDARVSMAQLIRRRLQRVGARAAGKHSDPLAKIEGLVTDGRLSQNIDEELYG